MNKKIISIFIFFLAIFLFIFSNNFYSSYNKKKNDISRLEKKIIKSDKKIEKLSKKLDYQNVELEEARDLIGLIPFKKSLNIKTFNYFDKKITFEKFKTSFLKTGKNHAATSSSYIDYHKNNLILVSGNGIFSYSNLDNFNKKNFNFLIIKNNFNKFINYESFYKNSKFGIKDIHIKEGKIYVSFSNQLTDDCYNISIVYADINFQFLNFKKFFIPNQCVKINNEYGEFNPHHSGGRIVNYKNNFLLSVGEYKYRDHAQNLENIFGKIILINKDTKNYSILASGLRNPQGLYYDKNNNIILSTDHGPQGGDEININLNPDNIENYGWPIASYGEHYGFEKRDDNSKEYKKAPFHKSHKKFNFKEPLIYFNPSVGPSEIIKIPKDFFFGNKEEYIILLSSMGWGNDKNEIIKRGGMSLHFIKLNNNFDIIDHSVFSIEERIRDMKYIPSEKSIFLFLENSPAIGIIKQN